MHLAMDAVLSGAFRSAHAPYIFPPVHHRRVSSEGRVTSVISRSFPFAMSDTDPIDPVDQQLIDLLNEKPPEELSFEELDLLRERLSQSPALRAALAAHLETESYLSQVLGNVT